MINIAKIEEYYLFNTVLKKILNIWSTKGKKDKMLTSNVEIYCQMKFPFLQEIFSYFQICYLRNTEWPLFRAQIVLIFMLTLHFVALLFLFQFGNNIFFNILPDFSANIFFSTLSRLQTIYFVFSDSVNNFFKYLSYPLQKNNGPSLNFFASETKKYITVFNFT